MSDFSTPPNRDRGLRTVILVALLAMLVRGGTMGLLSGGFSKDPDGYRQLAECLLNHGVFGGAAASASGRGPPVVRPTAYRPPLYPLLLASVGWRGGVTPLSVGLLHTALGTASVTWVFVIARHWRLGRVRYLAAGLVACDPILLNQSALIMTETLATFLVIAAWHFLSKMVERQSGWWALASGATLGAAVLCRPTFLIWLTAAAILVVPLIRPLAQGLKLAGLLLVGGGLLLLPWSARNLAIFGWPIATTTHGGYTLWLGNNDEYYDFLRTDSTGRLWSSARIDRAYSDARLRLGGDERAVDRWAYDQAVATIRQQPRMFAFASLDRVASLWRLVPNRLGPGESTVRRGTRYLTGLWYAVVYLLAMRGAWRLRGCLRNSPWLWGLLLCVSLTAIHTFYWSNLRMRGPLMPVVCLLAAVGFERRRLAHVASLDLSCVATPLATVVAEAAGCAIRNADRPGQRRPLRD